MTRFAALALALTLVVGGVAAVPVSTGAGDGSAAVDSTGTASPALPEDGQLRERSTSPLRREENTTSRLVIDSPARTDRGTVSPALSSVLSSGVDDIQARHTMLALRQEFFYLQSSEQRISVIRSALLEAEDRMNRLETTQRRVIQAYANESLSQEQFLRRIADVHRAAERLRYRINSISSLVRQTGITYLDSRIQRVTGTVESMQGPIRARIASALTAGKPIPSVHVEATETKLVMAMMAGDQYVREAVFLNNRQESGDIHLDTDAEVVSRLWELYPWVDDNRRPGINRVNWEDMHWVRVTHQHGSLTTYLDTRSAKPFREIHRLNPPKIPRQQVRSVAESGVRVVLNRTFRGGPMQVELYDADTGDPLSGTVELGNSTLGTTGTDGTLWFVEPRDAYELTVYVDGTSVTLTMAKSY